jgi:hypothetical protein
MSKINSISKVHFKLKIVFCHLPKKNCLFSLTNKTHLPIKIYNISATTHKANKFLSLFSLYKSFYSILVCQKKKESHSILVKVFPYS